MALPFILFRANGICLRKIDNEDFERIEDSIKIIIIEANRSSNGIKGGVETSLEVNINEENYGVCKTRVIY